MKNNAQAKLEDPRDRRREGLLAKAERDVFRISEDGVLERKIVATHLGQPEWVPVVPDNYATAHITWRKLVFRECHCGILGAHRNAEKTFACIRRLCWWKNMRTDVERWVKNCGTCLRFRSIPQKVPTGPSVPADMECWQEVMIDLEGPNPPDRLGNRYYMTYICCLCHGVFLAGMPNTEATEARRAFAICMFRSGTIPSVVRSDQGPEFKNAIMEEYTALLGIGQKFGTAWRPVEQGLVEGKHKEVQKLFGILVMDIMKCFPDEVSELLPCIEYMIYNTPGPHGYTPRDMDRRWSMKTPLERELHGVQVSESEPIQDKVKQMFNVYGQVRTQVLELKRQQAMQRADLSNRRRVGKRVQEGDYVLVRDNRPHRTGGRTPWKSPLSEPALVLNVEGSKITVRYRDGTERDVHAERVLQIPGGYEDFERLHSRDEDQSAAGPGDQRIPEARPKELLRLSLDISDADRLDR